MLLKIFTGIFMFGWFKKKSQNDKNGTAIGWAEYRQFKDLSQKSGLLEHFSSVCAGMPQVPFHVKDDIQKMVNLAQSLISYTGLDIWEIIECAESNKWSVIENKLDRISSSLNTLLQGSRPALERLRTWADENNLPPLSKFDSTAYQMTGFPRDLAEILTLRQLHLPDAGLTSLPVDLHFLRALESICVDGNKIKVLPPEIFGLYSLRRIDAEGNEIETIPDTIGQARHLQSLDLDGNNLKSISPEISRCQSLKRVYFRKQQHGVSLDHRDTPLSDNAMQALVEIESRGVDVRY